MRYDFIKIEVNDKEYQHSVREIGRAIELESSSTVHDHIESNDKKDIARYCPLICKFTAGLHITTVENIEEYVPVPSSSAHESDNLFVLVVEGDSMINAGIFDGDKVIVKQQTTANNGEIVVAMTDD